MRRIPGNSEGGSSMARHRIHCVGLYPGRVAMLVVALFALVADNRGAIAGPPLGGTQPLEMEGDIASQLVEATDRFLLGELELSISRRAASWIRDTGSPSAYAQSIDPNRKRLSYILGMRDARVPFAGMELCGTTSQGALVGRSATVDIYAVRWPALKGINGEGLLLEPRDRKPLASIVCIPHCEQTPEMLAGLVPGVAPQSQFARRLAESGCRVVVPLLINRDNKFSAPGGFQTKLTHREILYRPAFELGRHLIGYELHKVLAVVDWFAREAGESDPSIGVVGYGEGGMLALYAGALDTRIDVVGVSGHFDSRQNVWQEPLDRNVFGLLEQFGDAELASMIAPRALVIEAAQAPEITIPPGTGGGPGRIVTPPLATVQKEVARAKPLTAGLKPEPVLELVASGDGTGAFGTDAWLARIAGLLAADAKLAAAGAAPESLRKAFDPDERQKRQYEEIELFTQVLLVESPYTCETFMSKADRASRDPAKYADSVKSYRDFFRHEVIGSFDYPLSAPNVRSRQILDEPKYTGYEVVLDVFPGLWAYGLYLVPKDIKPGEKRPVVVCQHGLEGRPQDVIGEPGFAAYKAFAAKLAERGFITFAPQNIYIFKDRFRTLQRKANAVKKTLFSVIVPQHQQIVNWLASRDNVDGSRIGFYGLSYGGKSAMRIPALVENYALSICSADFNDWVWKNASTRASYSYVRHGEYEIFEYDLGSTFNYSQMAALICPRPFMVERGHRDGVGPDDRVAAEFARVRLLYVDLKIPERTEIEFFDGPHTINGQGSFDFLHKHLKWPKPE